MSEGAKEMLRGRMKDGSYVEIERMDLGRCETSDSDGKSREVYLENFRIYPNPISCDAKLVDVHGDDPRSAVFLAALDRHGVDVTTLKTVGGSPVDISLPEKGEGAKLLPFKRGDVVRLKSGGPWMTVCDLHKTQEAETAQCLWFTPDGGAVLNSWCGPSQDHFITSALELASA